MARPRTVNLDIGAAGDAPAHRPTPEMIEAARRRLMADRSLTAWVCGDPAPGQSALDKRTSERPHASRL